MKWLVMGAGGSVAAARALAPAVEPETAVLSLRNSATAAEEIGTVVVVAFAAKSPQSPPGT
jgi:hypothetical protein